MITDAIALFSALVEGEDDDEGAIIATPRFAKFLMIFVDKTCGNGNLHVGEDTEGEIIELLFGIAAKIRLQPEILDAWFTTRHPEGRNGVTPSGAKGKKDDFVGFTSKQDFPLCYQLIDHVHFEGRIGDFSRTGLLYIFEAAGRSDSLERWLIESDLPTLMASGLGALYSQLSRKLSILLPMDELPMMLALSDYRELTAPAEAENLHSSRLQAHMDTFLSYLLFWQDVLDHCRSMDVKQTLLDHFQVLFLEQLLYPSMLESSDADGGSSVAVLTYIRRIIEAIESVELSDLTLRYLLAIFEDPSGSQFIAPSSTRASRQRMTLMLMTAPADEDDRANPSLFNLGDLLQNSIDSDNPQTAVAALQLATVLLGKSHPYCIGTLLRTTPVSEKGSLRTHGALSAEIDAYLAVASSIAGENDLDKSYEGHLKDIQRLIETHKCSMSLLSLQDLGITASTTGDTLRSAEDIDKHRLSPSDVFCKHLLVHLRHFLTNNVELNLCLTEVLSVLMACPLLNLEELAVVAPLHYEYDEDTASTEASVSSQEDPIRALKRNRRRPRWAKQHTPELLRILQEIQSDIESLSTSIPDFKDLVNNRKEALYLNDSITDAMQSAIGPSSTAAKTSTPTKPSFPTSPRAGPIQSPTNPLSPTLKPASPSRGDSLRGRPQALNPGYSTTATPSLSPTPKQGSFRSPSKVSSPRPGVTRGISSSSAFSQRNAAHQAESRDLLRAVLTTADEEKLKRKISFPLDAKATNDKADDQNRPDDTVVASYIQTDAVTEPEEASPQVDPSQSASGEIGNKAVGSVTDDSFNRSKIPEGKPTKADSARSGSRSPVQERREASLSHIITNVVLLQEFILEVVAILQVRASLFASSELKLA